MKICSRCHIEKEGSEFRVKKEKCKTGEFSYLYSNCKQCDRELSRIYYNNHKNDEQFKEKNRLRAKEYAQKSVDKIKFRKSTLEFKKKHSELEGKRYLKLRDIINAKNKDKRKTDKYKKLMREYREKNKEKIYKQEVITKNRYHKKNRDNLTDRYAINLLRTQGYGTSEEIEKDRELIELKKTQVLRKRIRIEILKKEKNGKKND